MVFTLVKESNLRVVLAEYLRYTDAEDMLGLSLAINRPLAAFTSSYVSPLIGMGLPVILPPPSTTPLLEEAQRAGRAAQASHLNLLKYGC